MNGIKKAAACAGTQTTANGNKRIVIITYADEPVNDLDTWSDAMDYWCRRDEDDLPDLG